MKSHLFQIRAAGEKPLTELAAFSQWVRQQYFALYHCAPTLQYIKMQILFIKRLSGDTTGRISNIGNDTKGAPN